MTISIPLHVLKDYLFIHNAIPSISLVNYPDLDNLLKSLTSEQLWNNGLVLERTPYNYSIVWTCEAWIDKENKIKHLKTLNLISKQQKCMQISEILGHSAEEMSKWSDEQCTEYLKEHFIYTRPETTLPIEGKATKVSDNSEPKSIKPKQPKKKSEMQEFQDLAKSLLALIPPKQNQEGTPTNETNKL